jgi:hypothetical protein
MAAQAPEAPYRVYLRLLYGRYRARGLIAGAFAAVAAVLTVWELGLDLGNLGNWGKVATLLSAIFAVLAAVWSSMKSEIEGQYTLGLALAHGYYQNLVLRVLGDPQAKLVVFRPQNLDALELPAVKAAKDTLIGAGRSVVDVPVPGDDGPRTVIRVVRSDGAKAYLDFPRTLRTLQTLIDYRDAEYKAVTGNFFTQDHRALVTQQLIDDFFENLQKMIRRGEVSERVVITDSILSHL